MTDSRLMPPALAARKGAEPIVCLTAYTAPMAKLLDDEVDILLVGDSVGMVLYGMESTLPVTLDMMIAHGNAVVTHSEKALVVVDLPFGSYQGSPEQAMSSAARVLAETGAQAVKLEGGVVMAETIRHLTERGVPVVAHVGLMPQSVLAMGGYKQQGKGAAAKQVLSDAKAVADAGAIAIVLEGVPAELGTKVTKAVAVPTIGIGAGPDCDGQVLVTDDMLGLHGEPVPSFVRQYAGLYDDAKLAVAKFTKEVRSRSFPGLKN